MSHKSFRALMPFYLVGAIGTIGSEPRPLDHRKFCPVTFDAQKNADEARPSFGIISGRARPASQRGRT
jgi:hypothetical protein